MSETTWAPSPKLADATRSALQDLGRHWPRAMAAAFDSTEAGQQYFGDFAFALRDADIRAIPMAARQWLASNDMPPKPHALGQLARDISAQHFPREAVAPVELPPVRIVDDKRLTELHKRAAAVLGSQAKVPFVWLALRDHATTPADIEALRVGEVSDAVFDAALAAVKRQLVAA